MCTDVGWHGVLGLLSVDHNDVVVIDQHHVSWCPEKPNALVVQLRMARQLRKGFGSLAL
jgi:hypothetical protein